jgi:hypothetical protein
MEEIMSKKDYFELSTNKGAQTVIIKKYLESHLNKPYQE